jgi:hypothetical protein
VASAVLHNIGIVRGDIINLDEINLDVDNDPIIIPMRDTDGATMRDHIVQTFFT